MAKTALKDFFTSEQNDHVKVSYGNYSGTINPD